MAISTRRNQQRRRRGGKGEVQDDEEAVRSMVDPQPESTTESEPPEPEPPAEERPASPETLPKLRRRQETRRSGMKQKTVGSSRSSSSSSSIEGGSTVEAVNTSSAVPKPTRSSTPKSTSSSQSKSPSMSRSISKSTRTRTSTRRTKNQITSFSTGDSSFDSSTVVITGVGVGGSTTTTVVTPGQTIDDKQTVEDDFPIILTLSLKPTVSILSCTIEDLDHDEPYDDPHRQGEKTVKTKKNNKNSSDPRPHNVSDQDSDPSPLSPPSSTSPAPTSAAATSLQHTAEPSAATQSSSETTPTAVTKSSKRIKKPPSWLKNGKFDLATKQVKSQSSTVMKGDSTASANIEGEGGQQRTTSTGGKKRKRPRTDQDPIETNISTDSVKSHVVRSDTSTIQNVHDSSPLASEKAGSVGTTKKQRRRSSTASSTTSTATKTPKSIQSTAKNNKRDKKLKPTSSSVLTPRHAYLHDRKYNSNDDYLERIQDEDDNEDDEYDHGGTDGHTQRRLVQQIVESYKGKNSLGIRYTAGPAVAVGGGTGNSKSSFTITRSRTAARTIQPSPHNHRQSWNAMIRAAVNQPHIVRQQRRLVPTVKLLPNGRFATVINTSIRPPKPVYPVHPLFLPKQAETTTFRQHHRLHESMLPSSTFRNHRHIRYNHQQRSPIPVPTMQQRLDAMKIAEYVDIDIATGAVSPSPSLSSSITLPLSFDAAIRSAHAAAGRLIPTRVPSVPKADTDNNKVVNKDFSYASDGPKISCTNSLYSPTDDNRSGVNGKLPALLDAIDLVELPGDSTKTINDSGIATKSKQRWTETVFGGLLKAADIVGCDDSRQSLPPLKVKKKKMTMKKKTTKLIKAKTTGRTKNVPSVTKKTKQSKKQLLPSSSRAPTTTKKTKLTPSSRTSVAGPKSKSRSNAAKTKATMTKVVPPIHAKDNGPITTLNLRMGDRVELFLNKRRKHGTLLEDTIDNFGWQKSRVKVHWDDTDNDDDDEEDDSHARTSTTATTTNNVDWADTIALREIPIEDGSISRDGRALPSTRGAAVKTSKPEDTITTTETSTTTMDPALSSDYPSSSSPPIVIDYGKPVEPSVEELQEAIKPRAREALLNWYRRLEDLRQFRIKYGHTNVPQKYPENPPLGIWVNKMRFEKRALDKGEPTKITPYRIQLLEDAGFIWAKKKGQHAWEEQFRAILAFKRRYGHVNVPTKSSDQRALGRWVSTQRSVYKRWKSGEYSRTTSAAALSSHDSGGGGGDGGEDCVMDADAMKENLAEIEERIRRLDEIGFVWSLGPGLANMTDDSIDDHISA